jgi:hypothetical protein
MDTAVEVRGRVGAGAARGAACSKHCSPPAQRLRCVRRRPRACCSGRRYPRSCAQSTSADAQPHPAAAAQIGDWVPPGTTPPGASSPLDGSSEDLQSMDKGDGTATPSHANLAQQAGLANHRANGEGPLFPPPSWTRFPHRLGPLDNRLSRMHHCNSLGTQTVNITLAQPYSPPAAPSPRCHPPLVPRRHAPHPLERVLL